MRVPHSHMASVPVIFTYIWRPVCCQVFWRTCLVCRRYYAVIFGIKTITIKLHARFFISYTDSSGITFYNHFLERISSFIIFWLWFNCFRRWILLLIHHRRASCSFILVNYIKAHLLFIRGKLLVWKS